MSDEAPILRVTQRCLLKDLGFTSADVELSLDELASVNKLVKAFKDQRSQLPDGQETVQGLTSKIVAFTLHSGDHRGATWYQDNRGVVWLLAARFHRSGKPEDAYPYFRQLDADGHLLPTRADLVALEHARAGSFAASLIAEVPVLSRRAEAQPGEVIVAVVGGRVAVRLIHEPGDPAFVTVAVSYRMKPGTTALPTNWLLAVAAAFFPNPPAESLSAAPDLGGHPLLDDEIAFCDFA